MSGLNICKVPLFVSEDGQHILNYFTNILLTDLPRRVNDSFRTKSTNAWGQDDLFFLNVEGCFVNVQILHHSDLEVEYKWSVLFRYAASYTLQASKSFSDWFKI